MTPVLGSATADTSAIVLPEQPVSVCQRGLGSDEHPDPAFVQAISSQPRALAAGSRDVPPTPTTSVYAAGYWTPYPLSPLEAVMTTPGWLSQGPFPAVPETDDVPPQLLEMNFAPSWIAVSSAALRSLAVGEFASTTMMWQFGQIADTMSTSSTSSPPQPPS